MGFLEIFGGVGRGRRRGDGGDGALFGEVQAEASRCARFRNGGRGGRRLFPFDTCVVGLG